MKLLANILLSTLEIINNMIGIHAHREHPEVQTSLLSSSQLLSVEETKELIFNVFKQKKLIYYLRS
mgnify:FL=1